MRAEQNTMVSRCGSSALPRLSLLRPAKRFFDQYSFEIRCTVAVPFLQCRSYRQRGWPSGVRRLDPDCSSRLFSAGAEPLVFPRRGAVLSRTIFICAAPAPHADLSRPALAPRRRQRRGIAHARPIRPAAPVDYADLRLLPAAFCATPSKAFALFRAWGSAVVPLRPLAVCGLRHLRGAAQPRPVSSLSAGSAAAVQFCMWALYLPSQVLIALSVRRRPTA